MWRAAQARLPAGALRNGHRVVGFAQNAAGVTARFALPDGTIAEKRGAVLVGADSIKLTVYPIAKGRIAATD